MKTIIWDIDDVLNEMMRLWLERYWVPSHPNCTLIYEEITGNPPHSLLGVSISEYLASLDDFRLSKIAEEMTPVPEVLSWFQQNGEYFRHVGLTSVPLIASSRSAAWVMKYFGQWIRTFHVVPSSRECERIPVYDQSKEDFLRWFGKADIFVDDNHLNIESAQKLGIHTILIPRPWNGSRITLAESLQVLSSYLGI